MQLKEFKGIPLKKHFQAVDVEDAAVAESAAFAGNKDFDIAPTSVMRLSFFA